MHVLVTGGAGFIGSHLVERLVNDGHVVSVIDNFSTGRRNNLQAALTAGLDPRAVFDVDVVDRRAADIASELRPDVLVHLAAQSRVDVSMRDPLLDLETNVLGLARMYAAVQRCGAKRVVLASSGGTIYGSAARRDGPTPESEQRRPVSFYGLSKHVADEYCRLHHETFGVDYVSLALGNVYGHRQDPHGESGVLAIFAHRLVAGLPCEITGDGSAVRDYVHVQDVVDAFVRALDRGTGLVNIGTGVGTSVQEAYKLLSARVGSDRPPVLIPARRGEVGRIVLDPSRAQRELGWRATVPLPEGIDNLLSAVRMNGHV